MVNPQTPRSRSSTPWKQLPLAGIRHQLPSSGVANAQPDEGVRDNVSWPLVVLVLVFPDLLVAALPLSKNGSLRANRPTSELDVHITSLEEHFRHHPPATIKEAQHEIEMLTGIKRSETQVREFLKKNSIFAVAKSA